MLKKLMCRAAILVAVVWGFLDSEVIFGEAQPVTSTGDTPSTNSYDTANASGGGAGQTGENLWVQVACSTTVTSAGSATVQAVLQDSADNSSFADVAAGPVLAKAAVLAGTYLLRLQPPPGMRRYWRIVYRVGTAALTAGAFDAFVTNSLQRNVPDPSGFSVS